jgi:ribosome maturation factor RimP
MAQLDEIRTLVGQKLASMGLELYELKFIPAGPHSVMRIYIDKEGGVSIDDCEKASHEISMLLDVEEYPSVAYRLEVSSPGSDRPLRTERDFRRTTGHNIRAQISGADGRERSVTGLVERCENGTLYLNDKDVTIDIPVSQVKYAKIEFSFK